MMYSYNLATNVYKEMDVTYGEMAHTLTQLGFKDESTPELFLLKCKTRFGKSSGF